MEDNKQKPGLKPGDNQNPNLNPRKGPKFNIYWVYGLILLAIVGAQFFSGNIGGSSAEYSFQTLKDYLNKGEVTKLVVINNEHVDVYRKAGTPPPAGVPKSAIGTQNDKAPVFAFKIGTVDQFSKDLADAEKNL